MTPRALVVGYGRMGKFHRRVLADLGYAVTSVDPEPRAAAMCRRIPAEPFDVVCIATPIRDLAVQAARWAGRTGHLLIEKPMATTLDEASQLIEALENQRTCVGYVERFNPRLLDVKRELEARGPASSAMFCRWNDRPSKHPALDLMSHDIDLAHYLGVTEPLFDTRASMPWKRREVIVGVPGGSIVADLLAHEESPLHAQWRAFLAGEDGPATPQDALRVHEVLASERERVLV